MIMLNLHKKPSETVTLVSAVNEILFIGGVPPSPEGNRVAVASSPMLPDGGLGTQNDNSRRILSKGSEPLDE